MKEIFENLLFKLKELNVFKTIYIFNNHIDKIRTGKINFLCPGIFVEIQQQLNTVLTLQQGVSSWDIKIRFHICDFQLDGLNNTFNQNLTVFNYRNLIRKTFVQYFPPRCSGMMADGEDQDYKHNNIYHYIQNFKTNYTDITAYQKAQPVYILKGYVYWDVNELIWDECLLLWDEAIWGFPSLSIDEEVLINPPSNDIIYGNDIVSIYKSIFNQVNTLVGKDNKTIFKNVYVFDDQIKRMVNGIGSVYDIYNTPCVYIEITYDQERPLQNKLSQMDLVITFHIVMMELDALHNNLDQNTKIFGLRDLINEKFVLFFAPQCSPFRYYSEKQDYNHGNIYHYKISYKTNYIDQTAYQPLGTMSATLSASFSVVSNIS